MIKIKSQITKKEVFAVDATLEFVFGECIVSYDVYWASTGEIFPKDKTLSFDALMGKIYDLPKDTWNSNLLYNIVYINDNKNYSSDISGNSNKGIYTNKYIIAQYIKQKLTPPNQKINKLKF